MIGWEYLGICIRQMIGWKIVSQTTCDLSSGTLNSAITNLLVFYGEKTAGLRKCTVCVFFQMSTVVNVID